MVSDNIRGNLGSWCSSAFLPGLILSVAVFQA